jgi:HEAT repeat protein
VHWVASLLVMFTAASASAEAFSVRRSVPLGRPATPASVVVRERDQTVVLEVDRARAELPISAPLGVEVEPVSLPRGGALAIVRVKGAAGREAVALLSRTTQGRVEILWTGALDLRGDPGERSAGVIARDARAIDTGGAESNASVVVGQINERARVCGEAPSPLYPRAVDPNSMQLRPAMLARVPEPGERSEASPQSPGPTSPPVLRALRSSAVSSQPGMQAQPGWLDVANALTDGDLSTAWRADNPGGSRGEFATFQWNGDGLPIRALAFVPVPTGLAGGAGVSIPRALWVVADDGMRIELRLPEAPEPGRRYWFALAKPLQAHCVSIVIGDAAPLAAGNPGPAVIAEVEAYTDLDFEGGVDRLVKELDGAGAGEAEHSLTAAGKVAVTKLCASWPALTPAGRRRAARVLGHSAENDPAARQQLAAALDDGDADVRTTAFAALLAAGPASRQALMPRAAQPGEQGDAAATALARQAPREALPALLAALAQPSGSERPVLREAIAVSSQGAGAAAADEVRAWAQRNDDNLAARASLALALTTSGEMLRPIAAEIVAADRDRAERFEDRWRLVQAARGLPSSADVDAWLAKLAKTEERWMLRAAAIQALAERNASERIATAKAALGDDYSRVRVAAAGVLASDAGARDVLAMHAERDPWVPVRIAALEALASQRGTEALVQRGVADPSRLVRASAVRMLAKAHAQSAWAAVERRLADADEWPQVVAESIRFADSLCERRATKPLLAVLQRGIKPDAWAPDADNAQLALGTLLRFGGDAAKSARDLAASQGGPDALKAAEAAKLPPCPAVPAPAN